MKNKKEETHRYRKQTVLGGKRQYMGGEMGGSNYWV